MFVTYFAGVVTEIQTDFNTKCSSLVVHLSIQVITYYKNVLSIVYPKTKYQQAVGANYTESVL